MAKISLTSQISAQQNAIKIMKSAGSGLRSAEKALLVSHLEAGIKTLQYVQTNIAAIRAMAESKS